MTDKCDRRDQFQRLLEKIQATDSLAEARAAAFAAANLMNRFGIFDVQNVDTSFLRAQLSAKDREIDTLRREVRELEHWRAIGLEHQAREEQQARWQAEWRTRQLEHLRPEVLALFDAEPLQHGADGIAKKLRRNTEQVRIVIRQLVSDGELVAAGTTRNRTYSRPPHIERESFPSEPKRTQNSSRPAQSGRVRSA